MAQLIVRDLEREVKTRLQRRAKRHGRSMEEEVREILRDAAKDPKHASAGLGTQIASRFRKTGLKRGEELRKLRPIDLRQLDFEE